MHPNLPMELIETVLDQIEDGVLIAFPDGKISYCNGAVHDLFGLPKEREILTLKDLGAIDWNKRIVRAAVIAGNQYGMATSSDVPMKFEEKIVAGSSVRFLEFTVRRLFSGRRKHEMRLIVARDISTRRCLEATLDAPSICGLKTNSPKMLSLMERARQIAASDASVLLQGESGTGKSCVARLIHQQSRRANRPLVEINCAAIPETLMESEFFGHAKGAFTGATEKRHGKFFAANDGTLFLDEIGEIPIHTQAKLLHAIDERRFSMVGSNETITVNTRFISASNVDLRDAVDRGAFRGDLYYRVAVIPLLIPPLRERVGDIPVLIEHFLDDLSLRGQKADVKFAKDAWQALLNYPWPGNIRELSNAVEHAVICADKGMVELDSLPRDIRLYAQFKPELEFARSPAADDEERGAVIDPLREEMIAALKKAQGSKSLAAQLLGIDRTTLWRRMQKAGISG